MRYRSSLLTFIWIREMGYFSEFFKVLVLDHGEFFDLLFLDVDFVKVFFLIELKYFDSVFDGLDVPFSLEEVFDSTKWWLLGGFGNQSVIIKELSFLLYTHFFIINSFFLFPHSFFIPIHLD